MDIKKWLLVMAETRRAKDWFQRTHPECQIRMICHGSCGKCDCAEKNPDNLVIEFDSEFVKQGLACYGCQKVQ